MKDICRRRMIKAVRRGCGRCKETLTGFFSKRSASLPLSIGLCSDNSVSWENAYDDSATLTSMDCQEQEDMDREILTIMRRALDENYPGSISSNEVKTSVARPPQTSSVLVPDETTIDHPLTHSQNDRSAMILRIRTKIRQLGEKRQGLLGMQVKAQEARNSIRLKRSALTELNARILQDIQRTAALGIPNGPTPSPELLLDLQEVLDDLQVDEAELNATQDLLNRKEWELKEAETEIYQSRNFQQVLGLADDSTSFSEEEIVEMASNSTVSAQPVLSPLEKQYLSRKGDAEILNEQLFELRAERAHCVEEERVRRAMGKTLDLEGQHFLKDFDTQHRQLQQDLFYAEEDIFKLQSMLDDDERSATLTIMNNLANGPSDQGKYDEAEMIYREISAVTEKIQFQSLLRALQDWQCAAEETTKLINRDIASYHDRGGNGRQMALAPSPKGHLHQSERLTSASLMLCFLPPVSAANVTDTGVATGVKQNRPDLWQLLYDGAEMSLAWAPPVALCGSCFYWAYRRSRPAVNRTQGDRTKDIRIAAGIGSVMSIVLADPSCSVAWKTSSFGTSIGLLGLYWNTVFSDHDPNLKWLSANVLAGIVFDGVVCTLAGSTIGAGLSLFLQLLPTSCWLTLTICSWILPTAAEGLLPFHI
jgi:hypothetical protein